MLIEFRVQNHRSIRDEQVLTLESSRSGQSEDRRLQLGPSGGHLLPAAGLYGANASGKSNVLAALSFMRDAVVRSHRVWLPDRGVPREPFAWGEGKSTPSLFEITFIQNQVRFQYGFVADDERFLEEWLHAWPGKRRQTWFTRTKDQFRFGEYLEGENKVVQQVTRPNALFLAAAAQHSHEQLTPLYWWFRSLRTVNVGRRRGGGRMLFGGPVPDPWFLKSLEVESSSQQSLFDDDEVPADRRGALLELLRAADVGIVDIKVEQEQQVRSAAGEWSRSRVFLKHKSNSPDAWLELDEESHGTRILFNLGPAVIDTLWRGAVLLVDELEASLHPLLALRLLQQFNNPQANPRFAQLVFTTHDTTLLGTVAGVAPLRRDQVWLTEKDDQGATTLYPLTDYKPRKVANLQRGYLQGRYGAIPFLGSLANVEE